eukprot:TRINITY_DN17209_c0_g1_i1.p1 TRINITY_DN17209_c0_g1~~TRINITY_DN17209_c0_g1_i1.p1  ORF type:complete len:153 (+),score=3.16 TRINITY_DN17209_c0_g1_i1:326-784(+)
MPVRPPPPHRLHSNDTHGDGRSVGNGGDGSEIGHPDEEGHPILGRAGEGHPPKAGVEGRQKDTVSERGTDVLKRGRRATSWRAQTSGGKKKDGGGGGGQGTGRVNRAGAGSGGAGKGRGGSASQLQRRGNGGTAGRLGDRRRRRVRWPRERP